jgi:hypothetical protein
VNVRLDAFLGEHLTMANPSAALMNYPFELSIVESGQSVQQLVLDALVCEPREVNELSPDSCATSPLTSGKTSPPNKIILVEIFGYFRIMRLPGYF